MDNKKILYLTRTMGIGGTEKVIMQLCNNFNSKFEKVIVCSCGGVHEDELEKKKIKHYKISDMDDKNIINIIKNIKIIIDIIKQENINIVHTHHRMAAFYMSIIKLFVNVKFIHTAHNTFTDKKILTRLALGKAEVVAVGNKVKENLCHFYGIVESKVTVIYNGIEENLEPIRNVEEISKYIEKGYYTVGNIGRLSEQKGMEYYIKSIPDILKINNKIIFYIIGEGDKKNELLKLVSNLNIQENVKFLGYRDDVINIMKQLDLIVLSSLWEGLPLTPIEAFSVRKTIIATAVDGTSEIVINNYNGKLIRPKSSKDISESVIELFFNSNQKSRFEINAYKMFKDKFSIERFNDKYEEFYNCILIK